MTVEICPVCGKGEKDEVLAAIADAEKAQATLKTQIRVWKRRVKQIDRAKAKAAGESLTSAPQPSRPMVATPPDVQAQGL